MQSLDELKFCIEYNSQALSKWERLLDQIVRHVRREIHQNLNAQNFFQISLLLHKNNKSLQIDWCLRPSGENKITYQIRSKGNGGKKEHDYKRRIRSKVFKREVLQICTLPEIVYETLASKENIKLHEGKLFCLPSASLSNYEETLSALW